MSVIAERKVVTRKPHRCHGCAQKFDSKTQMVYAAENNDGDFFDCYWCMRCHNFLKTLTHEDIGDGLFMGDLRNFQKFPKDYINEPLPETIFKSS